MTMQRSDFEIANSTPILPVDRLEIAFDGQYSSPRLHHPEGIAIGPDGALWCGNAEGDVLRVDPVTKAIAKLGTTGGFTLGLAFDQGDNLFVCDQRSALVWRLHLPSGDFSPFIQPGMRIPNYPVTDPYRNCLYVSDSFGAPGPGPGVWRFDLETGEGGLWWSEPMQFANGMALSHDGSALYVIESLGRKVSRIAIAADGSPAGRTDHAVDLPGLPDGIAFDDAGNLYVSCYEPSRILRIDPAGRIELYAEEATAHAFCHPTNIAFDGSDMYAANLGRWHLTRARTDTTAIRLCTHFANIRKGRKS